MPAARTLATLTVSSPVDGSARRRSPRSSSRNGRTVTTPVDPAALAAARRLLRPGQRLVIDTPTVVRVVNSPR